MAFNKIPEEMKSYNQWVLWRYEELEDKQKPVKIPYSIYGGYAAVDNPGTWGSFESVVRVFENNENYSGIGFVLTDSDPYTIIDLDDTEGNQEILDKQLKVYSEFNSYAERSPSGTGLHIIIKANIPAGRKRSKIEIYSNLRYMTMTGDVYRESPIVEYNDLANALFEQMASGASAQAFYAGLEKAKFTDERILEIACDAANSEKFKDLYYEGNWQPYYPSQSEADFALFDIIAFYSENGAQTQRIFLNSKLAEREKSRAQYRINYMLARCFDRMLPPVDIEGLRNQLTQIQETKKAEVENKLQTIEESPYTIPNGLVGEIAQFIYAQAPRPVPEIALVGALGLLGGIVGRAYNISGTGLNPYILLLAPTGSGKEAIAKGIAKLMSAVQRSVPTANEFLGPGKINSEQAMLNYLNKSAVSFVSVVGEFGIRIKEMSAANAAPHMANLLALFLDLYNKSGEGSVVRPSVYSDRAKNTNDILSPAFTIIGESSPEKFYEFLDETMISSGMLPRFNIFEYNGKRPKRNKNHTNISPSFQLIEKVAALCAHALTLNSQDKAIHVTMTPDAEKMLDDFDTFCDSNMDESRREIRKHLWNRAHVKALKLSALVAVGINPYNPEIDINAATWAINLVMKETKDILKRFEAGEIGVDNDENKQIAKMCECISDFLTKPWDYLEKYAGGCYKLYQDKIVPYAYLQRRLVAVACFRKDRLGSTIAMKRAIKNLVERGDLREISKSTMYKEYESTSMAFAVANPKAFQL